MATLYVENVPDELYEALRERARDSRRSIAAEVVSLLEQNIPTEKELRARRDLVRKLRRLNSSKRSKKTFPSTEEMLRVDRAR
jgi:plasmid stability protein